MLPLLFLTLFIFGTAAQSTDICSELETYLPPSCKLITCLPRKLINTSCSYNFLDELKITTDVAVHLCDKPVNAELTFYIPEYDFTYSTVVNGTMRFPIPGLVVSIYGFVGAGLYVTVTIDDSKDEVDFKVGLEACGNVGPFEYCEPKEPYEIYGFVVRIAGIC